LTANALVLGARQRDQLATGHVGALADEGEGLGGLHPRRGQLDSLVRRAEDGVVPCDLLGVHVSMVLAGRDGKT
jgi:hypothetical protein